MLSISASFSVFTYIPPSNELQAETSSVAKSPVENAAPSDETDVAPSSERQSRISRWHRHGPPDLATIQSRINDLIDGRVEAGELTADEAAELKQRASNLVDLLAKDAQRGRRGHSRREQVHELKELFSDLRQLFSKDVEGGRRGRHHHRGPDRAPELRQLISDLRQLFARGGNHHHHAHEAAEAPETAPNKSVSVQSISILLNVTNVEIASSDQTETLMSVAGVTEIEDAGNGATEVASIDPVGTDDATTIEASDSGRIAEANETPPGTPEVITFDTLGEDLANILKDFLRLAQDSRSLLSSYTSGGSAPSNVQTISLVLNYTA